jgi:hypothetical protein
MKRKEELERKIDVARDPVIVHLAQIAWYIQDYAFGQKKRSKFEDHLIKFKMEESQEEIAAVDIDEDEELDEEVSKAVEIKQAMKLAESKAFWMAPLIAAKQALPPEVMEKSNAG